MAKRKNYPDNRKVLTKDDILNRALKVEEIYVPSLEGYVFIREMTALEIEKFNQTVIGKNGQPNVSVAAKMPTMLCARQVVDEGGQRLFTDKDIDQLRQINGAAISFIAAKVRNLSGLGRSKGDLEGWLKENYPDVLAEYEDDVPAAVRGAEENFTETPNGDSPFALPEN